MMGQVSYMSLALALVVVVEAVLIAILCRRLAGMQKTPSEGPVSLDCVYVASTGTVIHSRRGCKHLKYSGKVRSLGYCSTCSVHLHISSAWQHEQEADKDM